MQNVLFILYSFFSNTFHPIIKASLRLRYVGLLALLGLVLSVFPPTPTAEDISFDKTKYSSPKQKREAEVVLTVTDSKILIKDKKNKKKDGLDMEIPFTAIDSLSYEQAVRHRVSEGLGIMPLSIATGGVVMSTKTKSHWLAIDYHEGDTKQLTILRLDKSQYESVISTLQSRTGKQIPVVDAKTSAFNPTAGSEDIDEMVSFPVTAVVAALKPAMESMGCNVKKAKNDRVECKRGRTNDHERNGGGGEKVTAELTANGTQTRVRISTGKGYAGRMLKKNWSTPIYKEMMKNLEKTFQNVTAAAPK